MAPKKKSKSDGAKKRVGEEDNARRRGIHWRESSGKWVVEMRPANWAWKLNFGSYKNERDAMIARDYGAYLRNFVNEDPETAGGFYCKHQSLYEFEESPGIFENLEDIKLIRDEYAKVHRLYHQQPKDKAKGAASGSGSAPHKRFCKDRARKFICKAIARFRELYPNKYANSRATRPTLATNTMDELPNDGPLGGKNPSTPRSSEPATNTVDELPNDGPLGGKNPSTPRSSEPATNTVDELPNDGPLGGENSSTPRSSEPGSILETRRTIIIDSVFYFLSDGRRVAVAVAVDDSPFRTLHLNPSDEPWVKQKLLEEEETNELLAALETCPLNPSDVSSIQEWEIPVCYFDAFLNTG